MSLEDIKKKILADAEQKKQDALKAAQQQAGEILNQSDKEITSYKNEYERNVKSLAENIERGLVIDARRTLANGILAKKRERISSVYDKAQAEFLKSADYPKIMKDLVVKSLQSKTEQVILGKSEKTLNEAWLESVNKTAHAQLAFSKERGTFEGGVILKEGQVYINITAETLFSLIRGKTEKPVADVLFGR